jgi:dehydrogenase/reductase SDR family member 7
MNPTDKRMTSERCAHLTFVAIVNRLEEAWPCFFPVLPIMYFNQVSIL